jgi:general secretion pathway protein B
VSYILEALRKSQQERELGQVPTLDTANFSASPVTGRSNTWILVALGLAVLAVMIALYAALRDSPPEAESPLVPEQPSAETALPAPVGEQPVPEPGAAATPAQALVDAPGPGSVPREEAGSDTARVDEASETSRVDSAKPEPIPSPAPARIPYREQPVEERIPEDLRRDIEAFKDELRSGGSGSKPKPTEQVPPRKLRLPSEVKDRLPEFMMSVHVYDKEPAKRFVLIDALKMRQGDRTRSGIGVEEILSDGAVLSFEGHRFFRER